MTQWWVRRNICVIASIALSSLALTVSQWLVHASHTPPVGVYIGIMGLTAAIVSLFRLRKWQKFGWILFMTCLVVAEIRTLYAADEDQISRFNKISNSLDLTTLVKAPAQAKRVIGKTTFYQGDCGPANCETFPSISPATVSNG